MNAAVPERKPTSEEISGLIERVTFHKEENGFCVLRVKTQRRRSSAHRALGMQHMFKGKSQEYIGTLTQINAVKGRGRMPTWERSCSHCGSGR